MPPKRRRATHAGPATKKRKPARRKDQQDDEIPEVFQEMLAEAVASSSAASPPQFKTYIGRREEPAEVNSKEPDLRPDKGKERERGTPPLSQSSSLQIVYDDFRDSEDDDVEFEDVDLEAAEAADEIPEQKALQLDLAPTHTNPRRTARRKLATATERRLRLDVHKAHLLLLISAVRCRNSWCESDNVQAILKPLVSRKTISLLHPPDTKSQADRTRSFNHGIEQVCALWRGLWRVTSAGMKRAHWRDQIEIERENDLAEEPIDFEDFKSAAKTRTGSRDLGAQLFCALLRSVAIDTRLVCSLQVLPFSAVAKGLTPEKPKSEYTYAPQQDFGSSLSGSRSRIDITDSPYPIYWVEIYSASLSTWIPLDPLVRNTINKARTAFEPPASDVLNSFSYVVAFEDDDSAKDVTRRYTSHFNAKTRKARIESTRGGEEWYSRVMDILEKPLPEVRDELEDADFVKKAEAEGMPKNVVDFKGHPLYVLERHLRRSEVIHPRREVGKVSVGAGDKKKLESVFRRRDVHLCRTGDAWYRKGRDVREGMEPLKYAAPRTRLEREELDPEEQQDESGLALYAEYQTELYVPPSVVDGMIPKNKFGNLDVYVDSMIPPAGIHVRHPLAAKAAEVLGISFADAVTGFEFRGRQGTAVIDGVVVPETQRIAIVTVIVGLQSQMLEEIKTERHRIVLMVWKKWIHALRVMERVNREYGAGEADSNIQGAVDKDDDSGDETYREDDAGGGFMPDPDNFLSADNETASTALINSMSAKKPQVGLPPLPPIPSYHEIVVIESPHRPTKPALPSKVKAPSPSPFEQQAAGGFFVEEDVTDMDIDAAGGGGGFTADDDKDEPEQGGGFFPETDNEDDNEDDNVQASSSAPTTRLVIPDARSILSNPPQMSLPSETSNAISLAVPTSTDPTTSFKTAEIAEHILTEDQHPEPGTSVVDNSNDKQQSLSESSLHGSQSSMLSHDPDEEDAEPEWLLDSLS